MGRGSGRDASSWDNTEHSATEQNPRVTGRTEAFRAVAFTSCSRSARCLVPATQAGDDCRTYAERGFTRPSYRTISGV